jgi:uncharacterized cupin superfamily protein
VRRLNIDTTELDLERTQEGYRWRAARLGDRLGAELIGASLYELGDGQLSFPYHYHHGAEEWLYVLEGEPTVRTPEGDRAATAGELICFPEGPRGAHSVRGPARILMLSAHSEPSISVYPDSDKLGTRPPAPHHEDLLNFRRRDAVDYWEGE